MAATQQVLCNLMELKMLYLALMRLASFVYYYVQTVYFGQKNTDLEICHIYPRVQTDSA